MQINGFQQTIIFKRHHRRQFQRNELQSQPTKSHRRHRNMWTRLARRWQIKRHTLKVSDLYQSLFFFLLNHRSFTSTFACDCKLWRCSRLYFMFFFHIYSLFLCVIRCCYFSLCIRVIAKIKRTWCRNLSLLTMYFGTEAQTDLIWSIERNPFVG